MKEVPGISSGRVAESRRSLIGQAKTAMINAFDRQTPMPGPIASDSRHADSALPASFEAALAELEGLVAELEGGKLPLAEALAAYRRGAVLLQYAQGQLQSAQEQVKILEGDLLKNFEGDGGAE
jgi:exodeoxyribonuclease VII small subunit